MAKDRHRKSRRTNRKGPNPKAVKKQGAPRATVQKESKASDEA